MENERVVVAVVGVGLLAEPRADSATTVPIASPSIS